MERRTDILNLMQATIILGRAISNESNCILNLQFSDSKSANGTFIQNTHLKFKWDSMTVKINLSYIGQR